MRKEETEGQVMKVHSRLSWCVKKDSVKKLMRKSASNSLASEILFFDKNSEEYYISGNFVK
jgi:hypothetical protein